MVHSLRSCLLNTSNCKSLLTYVNGIGKSDVGRANACVDMTHFTQGVLTVFSELILELEPPNGSRTSLKTVRSLHFALGSLMFERLLTLIGALSTKALQRVVLDASHIDQKSKGILELKDTHMPLMRLLALSALKDMYDNGDGGAQIIFY